MLVANEDRISRHLVEVGFVQLYHTSLTVLHALWCHSNCLCFAVTICISLCTAVGEMKVTLHFPVSYL